jgi:hypothetical protein
MSRTPIINRRVRILGRIGTTACLIALIVAFIAVTFSVGQLRGQITRNRAKNVNTWCHAINQDRDITRAYINVQRAHNPALPALNLVDLPCQQLVMRTVKSNQ